MVKAENLSFSWPGGWFRPLKSLFGGLNFTIQPGELIGLSGPSGKGKSTLGDILLGLRAPTHGRVFWGAQEVYQSGRFINPRFETASLRCRYQKIFQDPVASFPPNQTLGEAFQDLIHYHGIQGENRQEKKRGERNSHNQGMGNLLKKRKIAYIEDMMKGRLEALGLEPEMLMRYPHQLSGGEMQRMALARVMLLNPSFIVADEPTSRLDLSVQAHIIRLIVDYSRSEKCAVLIISHDADLLLTVCDRTISI